MPLYYNRYLFECDYIYKHNTTQLSCVNNINMFSVSISLRSFQNEIDPFGTFNNSETDLQLKSFFFTYIYFLLLPRIHFIRKKESSDCVLKLKISEKKLFSSLFFYFADLYYYIQNYSLSLKSKEKNNFVISSSFFNNFGVKYFLRDVLSTISIKNLTFFLFFSTNK